MYRILFADDDREIRRSVQDYLTARGFSVTVACDGEEAAQAAETGIFDLIILDVMMPGKDGITVCAQIRRKSRTPVLFLSALGEEADFLQGYRVGADDYIVKPFPLSVLCEKSLAMIRRATGAKDSESLTVGKVRLDFVRHKVFCGDREVSLSEKDRELLHYLMSRKNVVLSRSLIISRVWGYDFYGDDRVVDTHIKIIRKALGDASGHIKTVPGAGYCFEEDAE